MLFNLNFIVNDKEQKKNGNKIKKFFLIWKIHYSHIYIRNNP